MTRSLNGRCAVITGAGSGMGRSMALRLAEDDARIAIWDINGEGAEETAKMVRDAGGTAIAIKADCSDRAQIRAAAEQTRQELGPILILVNNTAPEHIKDLTAVLMSRFPNLPIQVVSHSRYISRLADDGLTVFELAEL